MTILLDKNTQIVLQIGSLLDCATTKKPFLRIPSFRCFASSSSSARRSSSSSASYSTTLGMNVVVVVVVVVGSSGANFRQRNVFVEFSFILKTKHLSSRQSDCETHTSKKISSNDDVHSIDAEAVPRRIKRFHSLPKQL